MSKERLEVIEAKLIMAKKDSISSFTDDFLAEMEYLIDRVKEQAERVQELEQELHFCQVTKLSMDSVEKYTEDLKKQNKRYREALEFYANKINHLTFIENGKSNIEHDQGEKARKALEGEE